MDTRKRDDFMLKKFTTGRNNFREVIEENLYYVDKTKIIEELLENKNYVTLFPRPRRFGKSLFISMLDNFFNIEYKDTNKNLFNDLYISKSDYYKELSTRPVISFSFKEMEANNYESMYSSFKELIRELYSRKRYVIDILDDDEKEIFNRFLFKKAEEDEYKKAIYLLSGFMSRYYNKKVIILLDEYDVPIDKGYLNNFYEKIMNLIRPVFSSSLKDNVNLDFGVVTGVLRVSGESLFSTFNNADIYSIMDNRYNEYFGFTEKETKELLEYYGLELNEDVKNMYDGYIFGGVEIYNPWSIIKYADRRVLQPYWLNTSSNELITRCIRDCTENIKVTLEKLLTGKSIPFIYNDQVTYKNSDTLNSVNNILNLLFASGYLTIDRIEVNVFGKEVIYVKIPNMEVNELFNNYLLEILVSDNSNIMGLMSDFCIAILENNKKNMEQILNQILPSTSFMNSSEDHFDGYLQCLFSLFLNNKKYIVDSNRESGMGRFDLMIKDKIFNIGIVIELKITKGDMEEGAIKGLKQIEEKEYYMDLVRDGYKDIRKIAICFKGKKCVVR